MDVLVDGAAFPVALQEGDAVQVAVDAVRINTALRKRVITAIHLDGKAVPTQQEQAAFARPAAQHARLEFKTDTPAALALGVIRPLEEFLDQLQRAHGLAAEQLHQGHPREFKELLIGCVQGWELLISGTRNLGLLLGNVPAAAGVPLEEMSRNVKMLAAAVSGLRVALEHQDPSRLGDVMEYDLAERIPYWKGLLAGLRRALEA
jgi:hypothetical protein